MRCELFIEYMDSIPYALFLYLISEKMQKSNVTSFLRVALKKTRKKTRKKKSKKICFAVMKKYSLRGSFKPELCKQIYANGTGSIVTQSLYTIYIVGLNMVLKIFTEDAVTVLGIYYKIQSFFFIPLLGFQQVLLPLFSYHYGAGDRYRNRDILKCSMTFSVAVMAVAAGIFFLFPEKLVQIFSTESSIVAIGKYAFPVISISFVFAGLTIVITSYLQGIAHIKTSLFIIVLRQIVLLVPLA